ncbi:hypothetical protein ACE6H2_015414 [Prunus campanulata]
MATHSAVFSSAILESRTLILDVEAGGQIAISEAEIEMEIIGANLSTNPDAIVAETQQNIQPSGSREVDHEIIDDTSHTPDYQTVSLSLETTLVDPTTIRDEVQILSDHTSDFPDPTGHSTDDQIFQTTSADQTANASGELQAIPVILSNGPGLRVPQPSSDVLQPILTYQQHEVGESTMPNPPFVRTTGTLVEGGGERPPSTDQDDLIQSLLDHAPGDIFAYLDQWDASATSAEASTRSATSSTMARVLPDPATEALLRSYRDRDCISLPDKDERNKVKAAIEALISSGFFPDQTMIRTIMHLFGEVARLIPRHPSLREELRVGEALERQIASTSTIIRQKVELGRKKKHEVRNIDEQIRQLQDRRTAILAEVSEDIRSYGPLEAQLRQDSVAVKSFEARKLPIISALSAGESACESFRTALRSLFPDV